MNPEEAKEVACRVRQLAHLLGKKNAAARGTLQYYFKCVTA